MDKVGVVEPRAAAERFRSELRERLTRMRSIACQNEGKSHYIQSLEQSSAAILRAISGDAQNASSAN